MHAIEVAELGGPDVLQWREVATPTPGPGQMLVAMDATGVNYVDAYIRRGIYGTGLPFVPGSEGAGRVTQIGPGVEGFEIGDAVASANFPGSYAEQALVPADRAIKIPYAVTAHQAAAALLQGMTAHYLCHESYPVQEDDICLIHAGAGGVGRLLIQMAKKLGAIVIATASP